MPASVYKEIDRNKRKSFLLLFVFIGLLSLIGFAMGDAYGNGLIGLLAVSIFSFIYAMISYYTGDKVALFVSQAKPIKKSDDPRLFRIVENLAITAGLPMPKVYVIDDTAMNAFATGRDPAHASVAFTRGILDRLDDVELEGVAAHEMSHIKNYDIRLATLTLMLVSIIAVLSDFALRTMFYSGGRSKAKGGLGLVFLILAILLPIVAPLIATLTQLALSRKRESLADASAVLLTRYAEGLASALEKLSKDNEVLEVANRGTEHLYIVTPLKGKKMSRLFSSHPPIEERIKSLREMSM